MENFSYELTTGLAARTKAKIVKNTRGKKFLPFFIVYALLRTPFMAKKYHMVHISDPVLAIVAYAIKKFNPQKKIVCNIHGLDLTYQEKNFIYRWYLRIFLDCDQYVCISRATRKIAENYGLNKLATITIGIHPRDYISHQPVSKKIIDKHFRTNTRNKTILLTTGRLVKRKGVAWFVQNVLPRLPSDIVYLVVGAGKQKKQIEKIIVDKQLDMRVKLLGKVTTEELRALYSAADLFVMPNIKVPGDAEGFGLVALEASVAGLPVLAAKLEGIQDAIQDNQNGLLLPAQDSVAWVQKISSLIRNTDFKKNFGRRAQSYTKKNYSWDRIIDQHLKLLRHLA